MDKKYTYAEKLRLIADYFDLKFPNDENPAIQNELRELARDFDNGKKFIGEIKNKTVTPPVEDEIMFSIPDGKIIKITR